MDQGFIQNEIKSLNENYNVQMFSTNVRDGKAFAAEQKIRELKKRIFRLKSFNQKDKIRLKPNDIIRKATNSMNKIPSEKYGIEPDRVQKGKLFV